MIRSWGRRPSASSSSSTPLRAIQLPTLTAAARRPWRRSGTGPVGMAATSLPGAMTRMQPVRRGDEVLAQRLAGRDQRPAAAVQVPVEHGLDPSPRSAVVDATRRLVENRGKGPTTDGGPLGPRGDEPGRDAVDQQDVALGQGEGVGPQPHGHGLDLGVVVTRQFGNAAVVEVAAAELLGTSEGQKGDEHAGPPRRPESLRPRRTVRWR